MERAFREKRLGQSSVVLKNAFIRSAAYEGMYQQGGSARDLINHHVSMAKGGVAMTTVSYGAVSPGGRTFAEQMYLDSESFEKLKILTDQVHQAGSKVSIQLTHCGYFSKNKEYPNPLAPSRVFNEYGALSGIFFSREMTRKEMDSVAEDFARSAFDAKAAGFDAVEVHMGHGYLLSQFLSPATNRRRDEFGGTIENRARFPLELVEKVLQRTGKDFPVLVKLNLSDGLKRGFTLEECIYVARELERLGCAAIVLSGGFTSKTPFYLMRGKVPLWGMIRNGTSLAEKLTMALIGPLIIRKYRFTENFFLPQALRVREAVKMPLVYLGGVGSKEGIKEILDAGFDFIAIARALIHDSDFIHKLQKGTLERSECTRCNRCVVEMDRNGVKCVL
jgi:2,4-dienoyl-CoA reductase-like NADH-dependent reductase (Old Yellow Enzyme family)